jgi:peroxiredoxin
MSPQLCPFDHNDAADAVFDATGIAARAKRVGELAPDATLRDGTGQPVRLSDVWRKGPLVLVFYRGGSCGYCSLQLRARHQRADDLARLGATLLAISPQTPDHSLRPAEDNQFTFTVLSDSNLEAANGPARLVREGQHREALCMATGGDFPSLR